MKIKPYTSEHHGSCVDICKSNTPLYFSEAEWPGLEEWLCSQDEGRVTYRDSAAEYFYVVEDAGQIVGCGGFCIIREAHMVNLVWGMVHNSFHQRGFGRQLFEFRMAEIKMICPGHRVTLDTSQHTYRFFEKQGFSVTQVRKDFYDTGLNRYDMVL